MYVRASSNHFHLPTYLYSTYHTGRHLCARLARQGSQTRSSPQCHPNLCGRYDHAYIYTSHTYMNTYIPYLHTYIHTHVQVGGLDFLRVVALPDQAELEEQECECVSVCHTYIYTYILTYLHTYIHTYIQWPRLLL